MHKIYDRIVDLYRNPTTRPDAIREINRIGPKIAAWNDAETAMLMRTDPSDDEHCSDHAARVLVLQWVRDDAAEADRRG